MDLMIATNTVAQEQADKAPASGTPGWATDGNPATGQLATDAPAWHYNMMMGELIAIVKAAGITPSNADWSQVLKAMQTIFSPAQYGVAPYSAQLAQLVGGYPIGAVVFDADGNYWRSTQASNMSVPGADGAKWQSLFNGYATEAWANKAFVKNNAGTSGGIIAIDLDGDGSGALTYQKADGSWAACQAQGNYVKSVPATSSTNVRIVDAQEDAEGNLIATKSDGTTTSYAPGSYGTFTGGYWIQIGNIRQIWWSQTVHAGDTVPFPLAFAAAPKVYAQQSLYLDQAPYWEMGFVCINAALVTAQNFVLNTTVLYSNAGGNFGPPANGVIMNFYAVGVVS